MAIALIVVWVLIFAPLAILPFLPKVEGAHVPVPRASAERQVISISVGRQDQAA